MKIASALNADIIDCRSKLIRYTLFPFKVLIKLILNDYDIVIVNNIPAHIVFFTLLASKLKHFKLIVDFVNLWQFSIKKRYSFLSSLIRVYENFIYKKIEKGLTINEKIESFLRKIGVKNVKTILDAADHKKFIPGNEYKPTIVLAANLRWDEGVDILILAMEKVVKKIPNAKCIIIGEGEEKEKLIKLMKNKGLEKNIKFMGWLPYSSIPEIYKKSLIGVAPFRPISPFALPIKIFEYLSSGLIVIASDTPTVRTIIKHNFNGLLFFPMDHEALSNSIIKALTDMKLSKNLRANARRIVEEGINWESQKEKLQKFVFGG
jgi:glycosyltransferase involved in cell wall biosynthesis